MSRTGTSSMPPRPICRKLSAGLPWPRRRSSRGPAPSSASIMPSVTMKLGTCSSVVIRPLTRPMTAPRTSISTSTGMTLESSCPIRLPATTTCMRHDAIPSTGRTRPTTMTKYCPIAAIAIGAVRPTKRMRELGLAEVRVQHDDRDQQHDQQHEDGAAGGAQGRGRSRSARLARFCCRTALRPRNSGAVLMAASARTGCAAGVAAEPFAANRAGR